MSKNILKTNGTHNSFYSSLKARRHEKQKHICRLQTLEDTLDNTLWKTQHFFYSSRVQRCLLTNFLTKIEKKPKGNNHTQTMKQKNPFYQNMTIICRCDCLCYTCDVWFENFFCEKKLKEKEGNW